MDSYRALPNASITESGSVSRRFSELGIASFHEACRYVHALPYGYNSDRDDLMILFKEGFGSCATKHAVIATLAGELELKVEKRIGIYEMTEEIVEGADQIAGKYELPCVPMLHCFLEYGNRRIDLTEGNRNGKKKSIEAFIFTQKVIPHISAKDEYLRYRKALKEVILRRQEFKGTDLKRILQAREEGLALLKKNVSHR